MKKGIFKFSIQDICEIAILCALGIILDRFVKIPLGQTGGSLNFSMVPIMIICLRHGPFKGFIAGGIVFGLITCLWDGYGFQTYPLEYFVAFGSIFVLGFFGRYINKQFSTDNMKGMLISYGLIIASICLWAVVRFFAGSIDSVILYKSTWPGAFSYNAPYVFLSAPLDLIILIALLPVTIRLNKMFKTSYLND